MKFFPILCWFPREKTKRSHLIFSFRRATMNSLFARIYLPFTLIIVCFFFGVVNGTITLVERTPALFFDDDQVLFGPKIAEIQGLLQVARPLDACTPLNNLLMNISNSNFVLIKIGGCSVQQKVRTAQAAGFNVAIMYKEYSDWVLTMEEDSKGIKIPAMSVSQVSGETLLELAGYTGIDVKITANDENVDDSQRFHQIIVLFMVVILEFLVVVLIMSVWGLPPHSQPYNPELPTYLQFAHRMSKSSVRALPRALYNPLDDPNSTDTTCAICMEDFTGGAKLRVLPCNHRFHKKCIDAWLTGWQAFCPICKHDAREKKNPSAPVSNRISITNRGSPSDTLQRGPYYGSFDALC